jgi:hypothetical protein
MKIHSFPLTLLVLAAGLGAATNANATWTFSGTNTSGTGTYNTVDKLANTSVTPSVSGDPTLTISGVYAANGGTYGTSGLLSGATWASNANSALTYYAGNGVGMASDGTTVPNHALDNKGNTEAVLLSFSSSVVLSSIGIGYTCVGTNCAGTGVNGDAGGADLSVFRYVGTSPPSPSLAGTGASLSSMIAAGWQLVGNYGDVVQDTSNPYNLVNSGNLGSSWWLISAYNTAWGTTSTNGGALDQGNDYFKLYAVAGTKTPGGGGGSVPEPASIALVGAALLGIMATRRRTGVRR